jgi:hypothetical protein
MTEEYKSPLQDAFDAFLRTLQQDIYRSLYEKHTKEIPFGIKVDITIAGPREYTDDFMKFKEKIIEMMNKTPKEFSGLLS